MGGELDQLWYTWSNAGLGAMNWGYRVRAASPGLSDTNSMRYRRLDRLLRYELPQDIDLSTFDPRAAPISFVFIKNGDETLLIRKVFKGRDNSGRYAMYFTHLIAGLPPSFSAREAISLWNHPFWVDSEEGKAAIDTTLPTISSSQIEEYVREAQPVFHFAAVHEPLAAMIQAVLAHGLPRHVNIEGQPALIAALLYGLTLCLPKTLFDGLTFSTYEGNPKEGETMMIGTIKGAELIAAAPLKIEMVQQLSNRPLLPAIQSYTEVAVESLISGNKTKLSRVIAEAERRGGASAENLLELFKRHLDAGPLTYKRMLDIVNNPQDGNNQEDLANPIKQQQTATLLLAKPEYWEKAGKPAIAGAVQKINTPNALDPQAQAALTCFINALANLLLDAMKTDVIEAKRTNNVDALVFCTTVFSVLAPSKYNRPIWLRLLQEFAQAPLYEAVTSDLLWDFQVWVLRCAIKMEPPPETSMMMPWLSIPSWGKLGNVLEFGLIADWENAAIWNLLGRPIPKPALPVVQAHEAKFRALLQWILRQQTPEYTGIVTRFFAAIVEHGYPQRVDLLLFLLNATPKEARAIEGLLASVPPTTERQLQAREIETLLEGCSSAIIAAANTSPILAEYIRQYVLYLTPDKIKRENVFLLLKQLGQEPTLPTMIALLVKNWLIIGNFLRSGQVSRTDLEQVGQALQTIIQATQNEPGISSREKFINAFIPLLVRKIESEYELANILETFVPSLINSRWGLLRRLAHEAGVLFGPNKEYSRLTPYLICGLREYANNNPRPPQNELDEYLRWLYDKMDERALRSVDEGISSAMWPEWMFREWDGWRKREASARRPSLVTRVLQQRQPGPQPAQPALDAGPARPAQGDSHQLPVQGGAIPHRRGFVLHSAEPQRNSSPEQATQSPPPAAIKVPIAVAYLEAYQNHPIEGDYYQAMHAIMPWVLRYWDKWLMESKDKNRSKSSAFEFSTTQDILNDLQSRKDEVSKNLVNFLVDDLLIEADIAELTKSDPQSSNFLDPNRWMSLRLQELQRFAPELWNQSTLQRYVEQALRMLLRRHLFLQYLEGRKENPKKWIEFHRKEAKVKYI